MRKKARGVNSASKIAIRSMKIMISSLVSKVNPSQQRADFAAHRESSVAHPICHNLPICGRYALSSEAPRGGMGAKIAGGSTGRSPEETKKERDDPWGCGSEKKSVSSHRQAWLKSEDMMFLILLLVPFLSGRGRSHASTCTALTSRS